MLWRSNEGKDTGSGRPENGVAAKAEDQEPVTTPDPGKPESLDDDRSPEEIPAMTKEDIIAESQEARKMYDGLLELRKSLDALRKTVSRERRLKKRRLSYSKRQKR